MSIDDTIKNMTIQNQMNNLITDVMLNSNLDSRAVLYNFRNNKNYDENMIDLTLSEYYLKNKNNNDNLFVEIIENNYDNKDYLRSLFNKNNDFAIELINDLIGSYASLDDRTVYLENLNSKEKNIAFSLSKAISYIDSCYVTSLARITTIAHAAKYLDSMKGLSNEMTIQVDNAEILKRVMISDAFTYLLDYPNIFDIKEKIIFYIIDKYYDDFDKLWDELKQNNLLIMCFFYQIELYIKDDNYSYYYSLASSRYPDFYKKIKKINPFYILDEIENQEYKKYRR